MSPRRTRFRRSVASLALALAVLAGLAAAAYGLVGTSAGSGPPTPGVAAARAPKQIEMLKLQVSVPHQSVTRGGTAKYQVGISRVCTPVRLCGQLHRFQAARVWLRPVAPLPAGLTARFTKSVTRAKTTSLVLAPRRPLVPGTIACGSWPVPRPNRDTGTPPRPW